MIHLYKSTFYLDSQDRTIDHFVFVVMFIINRHFLLYERADLTTSTLLQRIRSERPQLHPLRLVSAATSTRE